MIGQTNTIWNVNKKANIQYEQLVNYTMLYDYGDECSDITGGWTGGWISSSGSSCGYSKESTYLKMYDDNAYGKGDSGFVTMNAINTAVYPKVATVYTLPKVTVSSSATCYIRMNAMMSANTKLTSNNYGVIAEKSYTTKSTNPKILIGNSVIQSKQNSVAYVMVSAITGLNGCRIELNAHAVMAFKQDNWQRLCEEAGLNPNDYTDESVLCDDITAINTILNSEKAIEFMTKQCTGSFMGEFVAKSACRTELNNSPYKDLITANEHWAKFLNMVA